uniref:Ig-like domain-containing protein n=1 Tax=Poecilia mexicana TaxID=48701 RepID=A0A3B3YJG4_9TELE
MFSEVSPLFNERGLSISIIVFYRAVFNVVGDSVELLSNLPTEGVTRATWKYRGSPVANKVSGVIENNPFKGRVEFNNTSLSLTIRHLTLQDSGEFSFTSLAAIQRPTVFITLQVHEPKDISNSIVFFNISEVGSNGFCRVFLECKANPDSGVTYIWTVGNQTRNGSRLQYTFTPQDGETTFTCNASNVVSGKLASKTLRCNNSTESSIEGMFRKEMFEDSNKNKSVYFLNLLDV